MILQRNKDAFSIDASLVGELLDIPSSDVQPLMRQGEITSLCERGEDEHAGQYRLTFFHGGRRVRLGVDEREHIFRRSIIDCGERR